MFPLWYKTSFSDINKILIFQGVWWTTDMSIRRLSCIMLYRIRWTVIEILLTRSDQGVSIKRLNPKLVQDLWNPSKLWNNIQTFNTQKSRSWSMENQSRFVKLFQPLPYQTIVLILHFWLPVAIRKVGSLPVRIWQGDEIQNRERSERSIKSIIEGKASSW